MLFTIPELAVEAVNKNLLSLEDVTFLVINGIDIMAETGDSQFLN